MNNVENEKLEKITGGTGETTDIKCPDCKATFSLELELILRAQNIRCPYCGYLLERR